MKTGVSRVKRLGGGLGVAMALILAAPVFVSADGYYRDARDYVGVNTSCAGNWWASTTWVSDCEVQVGEGGIYANAYFHSGGTVTSSYGGYIPSAGTYKMWIYHQSSDNPAFVAVHNGQTVTKVLGNTTFSGPFSWIEVGSVNVDPGQGMALSITPDGFAGAREVKVRGVYFTSSAEVPTFTPSGTGGDVVYPSSSSPGLTDAQLTAALYVVAGLLGAWAFIMGMGQRW